MGSRKDAKAQSGVVGVTGDAQLLMPEVKCVECGYDLRGTLRDGLCPECGKVAVESLNQRTRFQRVLRRVPWKQLVVFGLIALVMLGSYSLANSYEEMQSRFYCVDCTRREERTQTGFVSHTSWQFWLTLRDRTHRIPDERSPLAKYLDTNGKCQHLWFCSGSEGKGLWSEWIGCGWDPTFVTIIPDNDFDAFMAETPMVLVELKRRLRLGKFVDINEWLHEQYFEWMESKYRSN